MDRDTRGLFKIVAMFFVLTTFASIWFLGMLMLFLYVLGFVLE